ncbi:hypothetical protein [Aureliella helgolandensis]|uniref:hypothetical protein n=1 Tax=Aureliella helgolandensis TaxID=2527968 RepID=UPI0011A0C7E1|nr:hypothetical protein [Aureliella helgolandensis]
MNLIRLAQGTGLTAGVLKKLESLALPDRVLKQLRHKLRKFLVKKLGLNASKLIGRQGVKLLPGINFGMCIVEGGMFAECKFACEDGKFTETDTFPEKTKGIPRDGDILEECPPNMYRGLNGRCYFFES